MRAPQALAVAILAVSFSGCMLVDYAVDPVGCGTGTHKPIFPWYPIDLVNPPPKPAAYSPPPNPYAGPPTSVPQ